MVPEAGSRKRHRWHIAAWIGAGLAALAVAGVILMFVFWPFRYRRVHPLLESEFHCQVRVRRYYRTYFPHPGFVADGVTFWRKAHPGEPPLATMDHLHVVGTWTGLLFTPHTLYQIWLRGVHVRILLKSPQGEQHGAKPMPAASNSPPPPSPHKPAKTPAAKPSSTPAAKPSSSTQDKLRVETIVADGAVLDLLRGNGAPVHLVFRTLQIHNLHAGDPLTFFARAKIPALGAEIDGNGKVGPLRPGHYLQMPLRGSYSVRNLQLNRIQGLAGHAASSGRYTGTASQVRLDGKLAIPDFRAGSGHTERLDAAYRGTVEVTKGRVEWHGVRVQLAGSTISTSGSMMGAPKQVRAQIATTNGNLERLLEVIEGGTPSVSGKVSFAAHAEFGLGPQPFLKRLRLQGAVQLQDVTFVKRATQHTVDAFSARARKAKHGDQMEVDASASGHTEFRDGMAYFRDVTVQLPGATARLHGTFNLLNTRVNMTGTAAMQQTLSHDVKGWKGWLLTPLDPLFRHGKAGAVVPIAVTGTAKDPSIGQNLLHNK